MPGLPALRKLVVASIQSLLQPVPSPETLERKTRELRAGDTIAVGELARWLVDSGLINTPAVDMPGEFAVRGGIVDVFAPDWDEPVRMEFFGDQIESIRRFEIASQRSLASLECIDITILGTGAEDRSHLAEYLPPQSWFLLLEPMELEHQGRQYLERMGGGELPVASRRSPIVGGQREAGSEGPAASTGPQAPGGPGAVSARLSSPLHTVADVLKRVFRFPSVVASAVATASLETTCRLKIESVERFSGDINHVRDELDEAGANQEVFVVCQTEAEVRRLGEIFSATQAARDGRLRFPVGTLQQGFRLVSERIVLLSSGELFRRVDLRRHARRRLSRAIDSFLELREGDLVVHVGHGIARYRGLKLLEKERPGRGAPRIGVSGADEALRADGQDRAGAEIRGRGQEPAHAGQARRPHLGAAEAERRGSRHRPGGRHARSAGRPRLAAGHRLSRRHRVAARVRRLVSLSRDGRPADHHRGHQARHGAGPPDGPAALRRRGLREDGAGDAGGVQGGGCGLPGGRAGADHPAVRAAPADVHGADGRVPLRDRRPVAVRHPPPAGGRSSSGWKQGRWTSSSARTGWSSRTCASTTWGW